MKRTFDARIRKVGNSYVVTIPMDTIGRFELSKGDYLGITLESEDMKKVIKNGK